MAVTNIGGELLLELLTGGLKNLSADAEEINTLNVFPIPDGDTGSNMLMTLSGAVSAARSGDAAQVESCAGRLSRGALLSARGNSGVILSQFIKGFANGCKGKETLGIREFNAAFGQGVERAYEAVLKPVEGTMLTVMREGFEWIEAQGGNITNFNDYFARLIRSMEESLQRTPELLPILKESGVIDSGGAGFISIFKGAEKALNGEKIEGSHSAAAAGGIDSDAFNADSVLEFGYCTEFILQLQSSKVDIPAFDIRTITDYLETIGDSIVAIKDEGLVKVHVHTFTPGEVLNFGQKFGEFVTLKIENMMVQHNENGVAGKKERPEMPKEKVHVPVAVLAAVSGPGIRAYFEELGCTCVEGGQGENPSTEDFLEAFATISADDIIVLPNNSNVVMAARQAAELCSGARVHVAGAKTLAEGYAAVTMMDLGSGDVGQILEDMEACIKHVKTGLITRAVRAVEYKNISVKQGHFIGMDRDEILSDSEDRVEAVKGLLLKIDDIRDREVVTIFYGPEVTGDELLELGQMLDSSFPWIEYGWIDGGQRVYDYIMAIE